MVGAFILFLLILGLCLIWIFRRRCICGKTWHLPPYPAGGVPVLGHLLLLRGKMPLRRLLDLSIEMGSPIFTLRLGMRDVLVVNDTATLNNLLHQEGDTFNYRPGFLLTFANFGRGLANSEGSVWAENRKIVARHFRHVGLGKQALDESIRTELQCVLKHIRIRAGVPYDPQEDLAHAIGNIVCSLLAGEGWVAHSASLSTALKSIDRLLKVVNQAGPINYVPEIHIFAMAVTNFLPSLFMAYMKIQNFLHSLLGTAKIHLQKISTDGRRKRSGGGLAGAYLREMEAKEQKGVIGHMSETQLLVVMRDLLVGGVDPTLAAVRWGLLQLATHPEAQKRMQSEIDAHFARDEMPSFEDRIILPYSESCMWEILRLAAPIPVVGHTNAYAAQCLGYSFPPRTWVIGNLWGALRNPDDWEQPNDFHPQRFLNHEGKFCKPAALTPFSVGRRSCVGEVLARQILFVFLVGIMQRFTISLAEGETPDPDGVLAVTWSPAPYNLVFSLRR